jgi:hypothetical protein
MINSEVEKSTSDNVYLWKIAFICALLSNLSSIVLSSYVGHNVKLYFIYYGIIVIFVIIVSINFKYLLISGITKNILFLIVYSIVITGPITLYNTNGSVFMIFYKNTMIPFILAIYIIQKNININSLIKILRSLFLGSVFASSYLLFELMSKVFGVFPTFTTAISSYSYRASSGLSAYMDLDRYDIYSVIRPAGLDINFTASAFISASGFFIIMVMGNLIIKNSTLRIILTILSYLAVLASSSRQVIAALHIVLLILLYLALKTRNYPYAYLNNSLHRVSVATLLFVAISYMFLSTKYSDFIFGMGNTTGSILMRGFMSLPSNTYELLTSHPIRAIFGIGGYTPEYPGVYRSMPRLNELHYLLDISYSLGFIGLILYWTIIYKSIKTSWRKYKDSLDDSIRNLYLVSIAIGILTVLNVVHYSPVGLITSFYISLIPIIPVLSTKNSVKLKEYNH